jgi:hypothetical protein
MLESVIERTEGKDELNQPEYVPVVSHFTISPSRQSVSASHGVAMDVSRDPYGRTSMPEPWGN